MQRQHQGKAAMDDDVTKVSTIKGFFFPGGALFSIRSSRRANNNAQTELKCSIDWPMDSQLFSAASSHKSDQSYCHFLTEASQF